MGYGTQAARQALRPAHDGATPLKKAGAYLLTAKMADGNTSRIIVWIADTAIVKKQLDERHVSTSSPTPSTGSPLPNAKIEFFGYRQQWNNNAFRYRHAESSSTRPTPTARCSRSKHDEQPVIPVADHRDHPDGRLAYIGFTGHLVRATITTSEYNQSKAFRHHRSAGLSAGADGEIQILGRPRQVRSGGQVGVRRAQTFTFEIHNPQGRERSSRRLTQPTHSAESTANSHSPRTRRSASTSSRMPERQAARRVSASRNTRSPNSK